MRLTSLTKNSERCDGVVCSAQEATFIEDLAARVQTGDSGIRPVGADVGDQKAYHDAF